MSFLNILLLLVIMLYNGIAFRDIAYGILLCIFMMGVVISIGYIIYRGKYKQLENIRNAITVQLDRLPESNDLIEQEYQRMIGILYEEKISNLTANNKKSRELREYYTMWVHQIKTPIFALRLLLQERQGMEEELDEVFRIEQYVEMALSYSRLDSETNDFLFKSVELDKVIRDAVRKYARLFVRKKIKLDYKGTDVTVVTDEKWLGFVIEQLLSNAIKYTQEGTITVKMENSQLVIEDTGIGIGEEDLPRVFEKGYTGYNGHADKHSSGIGLYICSKIMKKLGHKIRMESKVSVGTKVIIIF